MRLGSLCTSHSKRQESAYTIRRISREGERAIIRGLVKGFWGEEEQLAFDKRFIVAELPAYGAMNGNRLTGFVSFAEAGDALIIVALAVLPKYQCSGVGSSLIQRVEDEGKRMGKKRLFVSASNDDLPALAFYQSLGFQIREVKPNVIAEKHGAVVQGIGGLPVRDELRLQKTIS